MRFSFRALRCVTLMLPLFPILTQAAQIQPYRHVWIPISIHFEGPEATETDNHPNPFLDFRLQVKFTSPSKRVYDVPGFFNGDANGSGSGNLWTVRFAPDEPGSWKYEADFKQGTQVAVHWPLERGEADFGTSITFDGESGTFEVKPQNALESGFWKWGRLQYVGGHYLKFADGPYFLKGGCNSPENLLAFADFDDTVPSHRYGPHVQDWQESRFTLGDEKGKGLFGALNYLSQQKVNSIYFLLQNIGGDGKDVWPFAGPIDPNGSPHNDNLHYDVSKLNQWNIVFTYAQQKGIMLHAVLNESEEANKRELDDGTLGIERKLFYREMIARFAHHNALQWNISEEYDLFFALRPDRIKEFAQYIQDLDPYDHPITVHNEGRDPDPGWLPFLGDARFSTTSLQTYMNTAKWGERVEKWRRLTEVAGRPLPINMDEFLEANPDNIVRIRKEVIWPTYLSGGNLEVIWASLLETEDFSTLSDLWRWMRYARDFMQDYLPFWEMEPDDLSVVEADDQHGGAQCFIKDRDAIYYPVALRTGRLTLWRVQGHFEQRWFNPRTGQFVGSPTVFEAQELQPIGAPPSDPEEDWAVLIRRAKAPQDEQESVP